MKPVSITEVGQMAVGQNLPAIRGIIEKIGQCYTGQNERGPWSIQPVVLSDGQNKVKLKLHNRPRLTKEWEGVDAAFLSVSGRSGLVGLRVEEDSYRGVTTKIVAVNEKAQLDTAANAIACGALDGNGSSPMPVQQAPVQQAAVAAQPSLPTGQQAVQVVPPPLQHPQPSQPAPAQPAPAQSASVQPAPVQAQAGIGTTAPLPPASARQELPGLDQQLFRWSQTYLRCMDAADWVQAQRKINNRHEMTPEHYQACVSSLFIQATRNGH